MGRSENIVRVNRTEALDASRQVIRAKNIVLPRGGGVVQEFAEHMAADVKRLIEDEETGAQSYRYVRTAADHYSLAFTYDSIAWSRETWYDGQPRAICVTHDPDFYDEVLHARW